MTPKLYMLHASPPVRAVLMVAKDIGLDLELEELDVMKQEQLKPEYLKINPTHTVPTLVEDDGFTLWDSHAILPYLITKYANNDSLYPKDIKTRAIIRQKLLFENAVVFTSFRKLGGELMRGEKKSVEAVDQESFNEIYGFMEAFLSTSKWIAGDSPSIADYSLISSFSTGVLLVPIDPDKFPKLTAWFENCQNLPGYEANKKGLEAIKEFMKSIIQT